MSMKLFIKLSMGLKLFIDLFIKKTLSMGKKIHKNEKRYIILDLQYLRSTKINY